MFVEEIFRFLLDNIFFLFIVIAGFLSMFRRMGTQQDQREERPQKHPLPPVSKPFFEETFEETKVEQNREVQDTHIEGPIIQELPSEDVQENVVHVTERIEEVKEELEVDHEHDQPLELTRLRSREQSDRRSSVSNQYAFQRPTLTQVTDGIVWAEILGPPRAKKPYQSRNRSYNTQT